MMFVDVQVVGPCALCGQMISTDTVMHTSLNGMLGGAAFCQGKIGGRAQTQVWLTRPHTIKRTGEVVPSMLHGRKATAAERKMIAPLIAEVKRTKRSIHQRPVQEIA